MNTPAPTHDQKMELARCVKATLEAYVENDEDWETDEGTLKLRHDGTGGLVFSLTDDDTGAVAEIRLVREHTMTHPTPNNTDPCALQTIVCDRCGTEMVIPNTGGDILWVCEDCVS